MGLPRGQRMNPAPRTIARQTSQCHSGRSPAPCATTITGRGPPPLGGTTTAGLKPGTSRSTNAPSSAGGGGAGAGAGRSSGASRDASLRPTGAASGAGAHPPAPSASAIVRRSAPRGPQVAGARRLVTLIATRSLNTASARIKKRSRCPIPKYRENLRERSWEPHGGERGCSPHPSCRAPRWSQAAPRPPRARCGSPRGARRCARAGRRCRSRG